MKPSLEFMIDAEAVDVLFRPACGFRQQQC